jgi:hypothetical protein
MARAAYQDQNSFQNKLKTHSYTIFILGLSLVSILLCFGLVEVMDYVSKVTDDGFNSSAACAKEANHIACFNSGNTVYIINEQGIEMRKALYNGSL